MNARVIPVLAAVLALAVTGVASAAVIGSPALSAHLVDDTVSPGDRTSLEVVLVNEGELQSGSSSTALNGEVKTARGLTVAVESGDAPIDVVTNRQVVGSLPEGTTDPIPFEVVVDGEAATGTYEVDVQVEYTYTSYISEQDGTREEESVSETLTAELTVEEGASFEVVDVDSNARVGEAGSVAVTVENAGSLAAHDARLDLTAASGDVGFGESATASRYVSTWEPGEQRTLSYRLTASDDAEPREYGFTLAGEYEEANGRVRETGDTWVGVPLAPEQSFATDNVTANLAVGDDGQLSGDIANEADRTVEDVVLEWASEQRNVSPSESEYALGDLGPGESAPFSFDVEVSDAARSGPRQFTLVATYRDGDGDRQTSDEIDVQAAVDPSSDEFDVEVASGAVGPGSSGTLTLQVTNDADEALSDVSAKLFADAPISASDDEAFAAGLAPDESTELEFRVAASPGAMTKTYPLSMDFQYEEPDGDTVTSDTYSVPLSVERSDGGGGMGSVALVVLVLVGAGLLAVGGFVAYRRYL